jgi:7-keto-8-aminopelargonate synthetase-like enzyme
MPLLNSATGNYVYSGGKRYSYFAGNNYLGLANHPDIKKAAIQAIKKYGVNFSASRLTTGTADIHLELERQLALFKGQEDAIIYASGYQGNGILFEVLRKRYSSVFMDRHSHPSISKNIPVDVASLHLYDHLDTGHLERLLGNYEGSEPLIITDGIFALTGEIAPLDRIWLLAERHNAIVIVDDAHSTGILGRTGKGTPEFYNIKAKKDLYQTETMSKALGSYGGFITGTSETIEQIRERSTTYQASTALPPPVVAASIESLRILNENPGLNLRLLEKATHVRKGVKLLGYGTTEDSTPIIPLMFSVSSMARKLSLFLEDNGIIVPYIHYPVSTGLYIVRIAVSVTHTEEQTEELLILLKKWKEEYGKD